MNNKINNNIQRKQLKIVLKYVFVCLLLMIVCCLPFTMTKYIQTNQSNSNAYVAKFDISITPSENNNLSIDLNEGQTASTYSFTVTNNSEVNIDYDIVLTFKQALPQGISLALDGANYTSSSNSKIFTFGNKSLNIAGSKTHSLLFTITESTYNEYVISSGIIENILSGVSVDVNARQAN